MHFQSFHSAWKQHKPVLSEPVLQPKHVVLAPFAKPDATLLVPSILPPAAVAKANIVEEVHVQEQEVAVQQKEMETVSVTGLRKLLTSPWLSIGLATGLVLVFLWGLACSMEVSRLSKQQNQLMVAILETLRS